MSELDSTNYEPPYLGKQLPTYPHLAQLVRLTGPALSGTVPAIYPCVVQQFDPTTLSSRDREQAYVVEPNGIALGPAIYDCRLVSSYLGLPLFATTCCSTSNFSSSSSASSR